MEELAIQLRGSQFYAHMAHNLTSGCTFMQDHEFFGDLYGTYEEAYDGVIERMIGLGMEVDIPAITTAAVSLMNDYSYTDARECYISILKLEQEILMLASYAMKKASEGTKNMLADMCDKSEARIYKIRQRIKDSDNE